MEYINKNKYKCQIKIGYININKEMSNFIDFSI